MMHRLFFGIDPPDRVKAQLADIEGGISGARWQSEAQMHITLRFIGEVDRRAANDIAAHARSISHPQFDIHFAGLGTFDKRGIVHTLYTAVVPPETCTTLHKKLDHLLVQLGLETDSRAYVPHLTLARLNSSSGTLAHMLAAQGAFASSDFTVQDFCLYESTLTREGAHYDIVARYPLQLR
jgi:RNA 2',3'-cyclic 3'-phosphodiesterase